MAAIKFDESWLLLALSGMFYSAGSLVLVHAFSTHEPMSRADAEEKGSTSTSTSTSTSESHGPSLSLVEQCGCGRAKHAAQYCGSDEPIAMWPYLLGTLPFVPVSLIYVSAEPTPMGKLCALSSVVLVRGCCWLVHASYASLHRKDILRTMLRLVAAAKCCFEGSLEGRPEGPLEARCMQQLWQWLSEYLVNDWLA
jgi:hypothetical protein